MADAMFPAFSSQPVCLAGNVASSINSFADSLGTLSSDRSKLERLPRHALVAYVNFFASDWSLVSVFPEVSLLLDEVVTFDRTLLAREDFIAPMVDNYLFRPCADTDLARARRLKLIQFVSHVCKLFLVEEKVTTLGASVHVSNTR